MSPSESPDSAPAPADFEATWREFSDPLRGFIRSRVGSDADADDLLQEVFLRIHQRLPELRESAKLQGWIYRIARHAIIDSYRSKKQDLPFPLDAIEDDPAGREAVDLTPALRRFLAELAPEDREPLIRHEYQGEKIADIAASLGLSLTATKSRVRRARLRLRVLLDRCCRFEFDRRGHVIAATPRGLCDCEDESAISSTPRRHPTPGAMVSS